MDKYQTALNSFQNNDLTTAEALLQEIVTENADLNSIYFLAVIKSKLGNYEEAIELYDIVLRNQPDHVEAHFNKALCHQHLKEDEKAIFHYKRAIELNPDLMDAHNNIAVLYRDNGNMNMAEKHAEKLFAQSIGSLLSGIGGLSGIQLDNHSIKEIGEVIRLSNAGEYEKARDILLDIQNQYGEIPDILLALGNIYFHLKEYEKALDAFQRLIVLDENNAFAFYGTGLCLQHLEKQDEALKYYLKAIELKPDYADAFNNIGLYYYGKKDFETAEKYFKKSLEIDPGHVKAIVNLGSSKTFSDEYEEALKIFDEAIKTAEKGNDYKLTGLIKANIGFCYLRMGELQKALKQFDLAIEIDPENVLAHYNKAETLLKLGRFEEGWTEYEWRKKRKEFGKRKFYKPLNLQENLEGKRILIYGEQGLGDTLHFVRYLKFLKERKAHLILECDPVLHELLSKCEYIDELTKKIPAEKNEIDYDYDVALLSLPYLYKTTLENIPADVPYIYWDESKRQEWAKHIGANGFKVGLVWAGSPMHQNDRNRSVKLKDLASLFDLQGTSFYSLQKGEPVKQIEEFKHKVKNLDEIGIKNFADTAAIIANLDLVITVDTSVAHLAGALGKEVWVLLPFNSDWRWLENRTDSPWYPTMKLYRQKAPKKWEPVFEQIKNDLMGKISSVSSPEEKEDTPLPQAPNENEIFHFSEKGNIKEMMEKIFRQELFPILNKKDSPKILDVGCNAVEIFAKHNFNVTGITTDKEIYGNLKSKGFEILNRPQDSTGEKDSSFDLIFAYRTLEKSPYPYFVLKEFNRILKPDGILYVSTRAFGKNEQIKPDEFSLLPAEQWQELFIRTGFNIVYSEASENRNGSVRKDLTFVLKKQKVLVKHIPQEKPKLHIALTQGENFGWGVCSKYLKKELSKKIEIVDVETAEEFQGKSQIEGKVFHALKNGSFEPLHPIWGTENYGYTFFENELTPLEVENSRKYEKIFAGSTWCKEKMEEKGITNTGLLIQGVDTNLFYPVEKDENKDLFIIFSGGKFELRKGQDLVLKAIKILQEKYPDIILINAWQNLWPQTMQNMALSQHIKFVMQGDTWEEIMQNIYAANGLDTNRIFTLPIVPNNQLRELYKNTDLGLFPNRCEGGTNLVLMEYMACAKPVVASFNTGHTDILTDENSLPLKEMNEFKLYDNNGNLISDWQEPNIDEIVAKVEWAYFHRDEIQQIGQQAGKDMLNFTWEKSAESLISQVFNG